MAQQPASAFKVFASYRMFIIFLLGFSSGLPLGLTGSTLQAWMRNSHVDLTHVGLFMLVATPYTFKFLWSPFMDRYVPPLFGRRRGWILICQLLLIVFIGGMAFSDPVTHTGMLALLAVLVAFFSASQDIVVDAYRTEILSPEELGAGSGVSTMGYRIAMLTSGAVALILSDHMSWQMVYLAMAASMGLGMLAAFFAPEPKLTVQTPRLLRDAVVSPFLNFFQRFGKWQTLQILFFILVYKIDVVMATSFSTSFLIDLKFTNTEIGTVNKGMGIVMTIVGALVGGGLMTKLGMFRSLFLFGVLQAASGLTFTALAHFGHHLPLMIAAIGVENFCSGMGTTAYQAFLASLCDRRFTATQFALLSSIMAATRVFIGAPSGWLAQHLGWEHYFILSTFIGIPGLLLLLRYPIWMKKQQETAVLALQN